MSDYETRFDAALSELEVAGIWRSNAQPPYVWVMRSVGLHPRLPHYLPFWRAALGQGVFFGAFWGLIMYATTWGPQNLPMGVMLVSSVIAGMFFGLFLALYYKHCRRRYNLSEWEDLHRAPKGEFAA